MRIAKNKLPKRLATNALLVLVSIALSFAGLETFLWAWASTNSSIPTPTIAVPAPTGNADQEIPIPADIAEMAKARQQLLTMPDEFKRRPTSVPGAASASYWQGALHVYNADGQRWARPFPDRRPDTYRVMVVGDSLTYGEGISEDWRFSNLLGSWLSREYRVEFINLGVDGFQSEDVLRTLQKFLPQLTPNLVIYTVCLNDFLPSGTGEYYNATAYPFPLPAAVKDFLIKQTRSGAFLNEVYDGALRRLHLRVDFYEDILSNFGGYRTRFAHDVTKMNSVVQAAGLPPLVAMVVDQYPGYGGRGYQIAMTAEKALADAGAVVIPTENFYRRFTGQMLHVSRWEGHPNEVANIIWANIILKAMREREDLRAFRLQSPPASEHEEK